MSAKQLPPNDPIIFEELNCEICDRIDRAENFIIKDGIIICHPCDIKLTQAMLDVIERVAEDGSLTILKSK